MAQFTQSIWHGSCGHLASHHTGAVTTRYTTHQDVHNISHTKIDVWSQHGISVSTKCKVYKAVVLPTLLHSAETYTLSRRRLRTLSKVHLRHLRQILRISWKDHIPNVEVLRRANMSNIEAPLTASQLRWTGHIIRMNHSRLPKAVFYGELATKGKRLRGGL